MLDILKDLKWLGHDSYCLKLNNKIIYIDPYNLSGELTPADLILITHDHHDHCSLEDIRTLVKAETILVTEPQAAGKLAGDVRVMRPGGRLEIDGLVIEAVAAYNTNKQFHPQANNWLGFIIRAGGVSIYHAGDTDYIPEMKSVEADIALLPVSGTYVMTASEAVHAALDIKPLVAIPMQIMPCSSRH